MHLLTFYLPTPRNHGLSFNILNVAYLKRLERRQNGDDDDSLLQQIEEEYNTEDKTGANVNEHLANLLNKRFSAKLKDDKLKEKLEAYLRPR